jgi:hypothetical protein
MNNEWVETGREEYQEDPSRKTEPGKSSPAVSVENQVTLHETVDRSATKTKDLCTPDKPTMKK